MFIVSTLIYPLVLALLCAGAGLLVDRVSGAFMHPALLLPVGAAGLIGLTQLSTYAWFLAPATPVLMALVALAGLLLSRARALALARRALARPAALVATAAVYLLAMAPVLLAGRATFSSFMALSDSAVHMIGADYLIRHGQHYGGLDLRNSYGQFINDYYNTSYPSGADTLLGGSGFLLGLPMIWAFQPLNAFVLACATGPAWLIARRMGLGASAACLAAFASVVPALVYGYELIGSVKEITALTMILTLGALVADHRAWLGRAPRRAIPAGLVVAAGASSLGAAFGAWALAAAAVLAVVLIGAVGARAVPAARAAAGAGVALGTLLIAAWPTWADIGGSLKVAGNIANTSNPGNLHEPLRSIQLLGVWIADSYKVEPAAGTLAVTHVLAILVLVCAVVGAVHLVRVHAYALLAWIALMLLAWLVITHAVTTWGSAKTLMLTSPVVMLLAWGGVGAIADLPGGMLARGAAGLVAVAILAGVLISDGKQYRASNLAPTARYKELEAINSRFAGRGPAVFTDFDEYSMYVLRDLDIGGPDFVYPPAALAASSSGYGEPVSLDRLAPEKLSDYPLIITRRDPSEPRPPAAYSLLWQGTYYRVWGRRPGAAPALAHVTLAGSSASTCARIGSLALADPSGTLAASAAPTIVRANLASSRRPRGWGHQRSGLVMSHPGTLTVSVRVPSTGLWDLWLQGQFMPKVTVGVDGRAVASPAGELSGNSLVPDTLPPIRLALTAGTHLITLTRGGGGLDPGAAGRAVIDAILLTPAAEATPAPLSFAPAAAWRDLCRGSSKQWVELLAERTASQGA